MQDGIRKKHEEDLRRNIIHSQVCAAVVHEAVFVLA